MKQLLLSLQLPASIRKLFPTRALLLLLGIGFIDLVSTAVLYHHGLIEERNPVMRPIIESSVWLFALVKGMTLALAWALLYRWSATHLNFVRKACLGGAAVYVLIWTVWFLLP